VSAPLVSVGIVTWNPDALLERCIASVREQTHPSVELRVWDNASAPESRAVVARVTREDERTWSPENLGFAGAHNRLIAASHGPYYLCLNPDAVLTPDYVATLVAALDAAPGAGSATGRLLRLDDPDVLDSTGIVMTRDQRHLDRGADEAARGRFEAGPEDVFGPSGAAALYRRAMLEDVAIAGEYFDEAFFAYREDADLAWRARIQGWSSIYVPAARAYHRRRVTPARRRDLPPAVNRYSVRNRFLLRLKNQSGYEAVRFLWPTLRRDAMVVGYVLLREHSSIPGLLDVLRLLPSMWRKRKAIAARRRVPPAEVARWFR
jgi:GT2 family glycosyltransferase